MSKLLLLLVTLVAATAVVVQGFLLPSQPRCPAASNAFRPPHPLAMPAAATTPRATLLRMSSSMDEPMILTEENAMLVLEQARQELGTMFGYTKENQAVGITGEVDFVGVEGISIIVRLKNRFWHDRKMVLARVSKYITDRIPEAMVEIEDVKQLEGGGDDAKSVSDFYAH